MQAVFTGYVGALLDAGRYAPGVHQWDVRIRDLGPYLRVRRPLSIHAFVFSPRYI